MIQWGEKCPNVQKEQYAEVLSEEVPPLLHIYPRCRIGELADKTPRREHIWWVGDEEHRREGSAVPSEEMEFESVDGVGEYLESLEQCRLVELGDVARRASASVLDLDTTVFRVGMEDEGSIIVDLEFSMLPDDGALDTSRVRRIGAESIERFLEIAVLRE